MFYYQNYSFVFRQKIEKSFKGEYFDDGFAASYER